MGKRRILWTVAAILVAIGAGYLLTRGPETPTPNPPGSFSFAVLGDAPYYSWEDLQYRLVLRSLDDHDLSWVLHVGDIFWRPCTDELYRRQLEWFDGLRHPVIYTPGDNEWTDCWEPGSGRFAPRGRLERIRQLFFDEPARTGADDDEVARRTEAATAWLRATFAEARSSDASAVVVAFHANPNFEEPHDARYRQAYEPFLAALEEEVRIFRRPVLVTHGDNHEFVVDRPLVDRTTGKRLQNFIRMQVPGSSDVGWVRVVVTPGAEDPFAFETHIVPKWKYW